jgi:two-component system, LuxR family, sensor kinase FixL
MSTVTESSLEVDDRFRRLVDSAPLLVFMADANMKGIYFNRQWLSFTGRSLSELTGDQWLNEVHPKDRTHCVEVLKTAFDARQQFSVECRLQRYNGEYHSVLNTGAPEFSEDGRFLGYISTAVDVSAQKIAEEAYRLSEMRCRAVFGPSIGNVVVIDCAGRIIAVNDGWLRFSRQQGARLKTVGTGANYLEVCQHAMRLNDHDAAMAINGIVEVLNGSLQEFSFEYRCPEASEEHWFEMIVNPLRRHEGGAIITHLNITKRRTAELQAQGLLQELAHVNRVAVLGELTASFAHELSQPLTAILSNAQVAKRLAGDKASTRSEMDDILSDIIADNLRAGKIIQQVRAMLKKGQVRFKALKLNKLVQDIFNLLRDEAILKRVKVSLVLDPEVSTVWGERIQLQQVVLNLMVNAFESMQDVDITIRQLTIQTGMAGKDNVAILVQDSGPGIPPERLDRIFEPFFTTKPEGLGMGLAICRSIILAHQGEISVANNPDRGVTFRVTLPVFRQGNL